MDIKEKMSRSAQEKGYINNLFERIAKLLKVKLNTYYNPMAQEYHLVIKKISLLEDQRLQNPKY